MENISELGCAVIKQAVIDSRKGDNNARLFLKNKLSSFIDLFELNLNAAYFKRKL